ncbi:hypothetical protein BN2476_290026 [Paraburkholderia piptadeniae]|uniref:Uncharacterized protein n=1 Tax=Paraburkholderia piptadeniae TaxID=1701573 RepID=A0A1N7S1Z8_9BURK|nr:hypothetical protein BN2476_290026 [Paraburkholderia piptadeniae]
MEQVHHARIVHPFLMSARCKGLSGFVFRARGVSAYI